MTTRETVLNVLNTVKPTIHLEHVNTIIDDGYLDSLELLSLISKLADEFCFEPEVDWITPENFNSVDAITALMDRLKAARG